MNPHVNPLQMDIPTRVESGKVLLRSYTQLDAKELSAFLEENRSMLEREFPSMVSFTARESNGDRLIHEYSRLWAKREAFHFGIWEKNVQAFAGEISLRGIDWSVPKAEVNYVVGKPFAGKKIATESLALLSSMAFTHLHMEKLQIRCEVENIASQRVAEHCGFKLEGVLRNDMRLPPEGKLLTIVYYGLTAQDFRAQTDRPPEKGAFDETTG